MFSRIQETINNKGFLLFMICLFLFPFFLLSFWNHPSIDDFHIGILNKTLSFEQIQSFFYNHQFGRYTYTLLGTIAVTDGFLYHYYWIFAGAFLLFTFFAFLFTIKQVDSYIIRKKLSKTSLTIAAAMLLILELHVIPEIKTQFYWFTSALTYQTPLILFTLMIGFLIRLFYETKSRPLNLVLILILDFLANGFNEVFSILLLVFATSILLLYLYFNKTSWKIPVLLYGWNLLGFCSMFLSSGIWERKSLSPSRPLMINISVAIGKFFVANWYFLKEPLWWLLCVVIIKWTIGTPNVYRNRALQWLQQLSFSKIILLYLGLGIVIYIPAVVGSDGTLPFRAENAFCFLFSILLLLAIHLKVSHLPQGNSIFSAKSFFYKYRFILFSLFLFTTTQTTKVFQSIVSGYFYHKVMKEREARLFKSPKHSAIYIDDFELAVNKEMSKTFTGRIPVTIRQMIEARPSLLYLEDYLDQDIIIRSVFGVEHIYINRMPTNNSIK